MYHESIDQLHTLFEQMTNFASQIVDQLKLINETTILMNEETDPVKKTLLEIYLAVLKSNFNNLATQYKSALNQANALLVKINQINEVLGTRYLNGGLTPAQTSAINAHALTPQLLNIQFYDNVPLFSPNPEIL
jgi:phage-related tail protein